MGGAAACDTCAARGGGGAQSPRRWQHCQRFGGQLDACLGWGRTPGPPTTMRFGLPTTMRFGLPTAPCELHQGAAMGNAQLYNTLLRVHSSRFLGSGCLNIHC